MVFYWQKRMLAEYFGETTVRIECNNCGCEYFYELRRVGAGSEVAPYSVGGTRASRSAVAQSERDLSRRLASEAELVPCPRCNWINQDLVRGYRSGRFQKLTTTAFCIGFFGTVGSLIAAWAVSRGPAADHKLLPYLIVGGPALSLSVAAVFVLLRVGLRSLIRPNRHFPRPPKVPRHAARPARRIRNRENSNQPSAKRRSSIQLAPGKSSGSDATNSLPFAASAEACARWVGL